MDEILGHPAVQGGIAPFVVALVVVLAMQPLKLGGVAVTAAFLTTMYFLSGLTFTPLSAMRKVAILAMVAPVVGVLADFAFKPTRIGAALLAVAGVAGALWAFWPLLAQMPLGQAWLLAGSVAVALVFMISFAQLYLAADAVRSGAAGLGLGLATGVATFAVSITSGLYGIALGAAAGAFLLPQMIMGKKSFAGATFILPATLVAGLVAASAMVLSQFPWFLVPVLALVPLGARLPVPGNAPVWLQAVLLSLYCFIIGSVPSVLVRYFPGGVPG